MFHPDGGSVEKSVSIDLKNSHPFDLLCYDFDGVMTDNRVYVMQDGTETVAVNRSDGLAIAALRHVGVTQMIMSTEENPVVNARAAKLKIPVLQGLGDKAKALKAYVSDKGIDLTRTAFIGNDINDLNVMRIVGFPVAPNDAYPTILDIAKHVTRAPGGAGVIREFCDTFYPGVI